MTYPIMQVMDFHEKYGVPVKTKPEVLTDERRELRHKIMLEEVHEFYEAAKNGDIIEMADGLADMLYIVFGTALECGLAGYLPAIFNEVHRSNMSKLGLDGKPIIREDGKVLKGPNFSQPDIKSIIDSL